MSDDSGVRIPLAAPPSNLGEAFTNYTLSVPFMRRGLLGLLLASLFVLAGCLAPVAPEWGESIKVERNGDGTFEFTSKLGDETITNTYTERGCLDGQVGADKGGKIKFEGYMSASIIYDSHNSDLNNNNLTFATTAAVAIEEMSFTDAKNVLSGAGERIEVKQWDVPVQPETGQGTVDLDSVDPESDSKWFVLGLIPASENINDGIAALGQFHQAVRISGYLVDGPVEPQNPQGGNNRDVGVTNDCVATTGSFNVNQLFFLVTEIELEDSTVSMDGEADDEYVFGDVPFLGRTGFILFLLIVGIGGGVGAYMYSSMRVSMSARSIALTLLGKEGVEKAAQVQRDVKDAKDAGMMTPDQRRNEQKKKSRSPPPAKTSKKKDEDDGFGSFSIDSALSGSSDSGPSKSEFGSGSSVVASEDAKRVEKQIKNTESFVPPTSTFGSSSVPTSSSAPTSVPSSRSPPARAEPEAEAKPKVRRRRAVRKAEPEPEPEPVEETKNTRDEEEEFSDFSF